MKPAFDDVLHLLHSASFGALATHSLQLPGYPFASALPFAPDEFHRPVFLLSGLAEHTKNMLADCRASFLVTGAGEPNLLNGPRMTITGDAVRFDAPRELLARFVRYCPDAEQYLALGDFAFFRLLPKRSRHIGGFARMGWVEEADWRGATILPLAEETTLVSGFEPAMPPGVRLLGIDCYGFDVERNGKRERRQFPVAARTAADVADSVQRLL